MRIVVNDIAASEGGGLTILRQLYEHIVNTNDKNEWIFLLSKAYLEERGNIRVVVCEKVKRNRINRLRFDYIYGKRFISSFSPDVVFYLQNTLVHGIKVPQIVYMDQSIPFQDVKKFSFFKKEEFPYAVYQHLIGKLNFKACKKADKIIVQTDWLKDAIIEKCHVDKEKIYKVYPDVSMQECYLNTAEIREVNRFFYPASDAIYKNQKCISEALDCIEDDVKMFLTLDKTSHSKCIALGRLSQEEVYKYMQDCVLVFPSYIESYGLPLEEAKMVGTIILAADTPFAREILDTYKNAYFFEPFAPRELAQLMGKIMKREIVQQSNSIKVQKSEKGWQEIIRIIEETNMQGEIE